MSISAIYFEIINCFNLIHLLISIPPSTKAVMKRQLSIRFNQNHTKSTHKKLHFVAGLTLKSKR